MWTASDNYLEGKTDRHMLIEYVQRGGNKEPEKDRRFMPAINGIGRFASQSIVSVEKIPNVENP